MHRINDHLPFAPQSSWRAIAALLLAALLQHPAAGDELRITSRAIPSSGGPQLGEVLTNGRVLLRVRCPTLGEAEARATTLADRLRELAIAGIKPGDVTVARNRRNAVVRVRGSVFVTVDRQQARFCRSSPLSLAQVWASALRDVVREPYIIVSPGRLLVPLGETRAVKVGGTVQGDLILGEFDATVVEVVPGQAADRIVVAGRGLGAASLSVTRGPDEATIAVEVRRWAARLTNLPEAIVTGGRWSEWVVRRAVVNAALNGLDPVPEAILSAGAPKLKEGATQTFRVAVEAAGEMLLPVKHEMQVSLIEERPPNRSASALLISNEPERIAAFGTLLIGTLPEGDAVRLLYHHSNTMRQKCRLVVRLHNVSDDRAAVHVTNAPSGPGKDELFVGHQAAVRFLNARRAGRGYVLWIPPGRSCEVRRWTVAPQEVISGVAQLTALTDTEIRVTVSAEPADAPEPPIMGLVPPELYRVKHQAGTLFHPIKRKKATYVAGGGWLFEHIGREGVTDADGNVLHGDYGVEYIYDIELENPRPEVTRFQIALRGGGGAARGLFVIDGKVVETQVLRGGQEEVLATMKLDPGTSRTVSIHTMPESASNYPVTLVVRSDE